MHKSTEVLVIGGGVTGCGVLFDLAHRGFKATLVERGALSNGTSGRFHGLLHSGGRYAVKDSEAARECIVENQILRKIMPHSIEDTGGMFVNTPWDPRNTLTSSKKPVRMLGYQLKKSLFLKCCAVSHC
jgi:glycerol-3-phosphate dehydrogenase